MQSIHQWSAKRSGAAITIEGSDAFGAPVKLKTNAIRAAAKGAVWPTAQAEDGRYFELH